MCGFCHSDDPPDGNHGPDDQPGPEDEEEHRAAPPEQEPFGCEQDSGRKQEMSPEDQPGGQVGAAEQRRSPAEHLPEGIGENRDCTGQRALQIVEMNKHGEKPLTLSEDGNQQDNGKPVDMFEGDVTRFDKSRKKKKNTGQRQQARAQHGQGGGERKQQGGNRENRDGQQRIQRRNGEPKPNSES